MGFEDLEVWKKSTRLSVELYRELTDLKDYGFRDQVTRSGLSIPSNISEGYERATDKDTLKFLNYAQGSCGELRTQLYVGMQAGYIEYARGTRWLKEAKTISAMLNGLVRSRQNSTKKRKQI